MIRCNLHPSTGAALLLVLYASSIASAASSFSDSQTGFTGNSTQPATQTAVALGGTGFEFTSTTNSVEDGAGSGNFVDPTVTFDSSGANFGSQFDGGRNFMRTIAGDYDNHSFVAEVTWVTDDMFSQDAYFGLGSGAYGDFLIADWGTAFSAVQLFLEVDPTNPTVFILKNRDALAMFDAGTDAPGLNNGTNRLRMTYDWFAKTAVFAIDVNYAGGAFTADVTTPPVSTLDLYGATGWPAEPGRVYFGGDDGGTFKDFTVTVAQPGIVFGDLTGDGSLTSADWVILRSNIHSNLTGLTHQQAYFRGDVTADLQNNHEDFFAFKTLYDDANGAGAFNAMLAGIPEPSTPILISLAALIAVFRRRR
ncbi:MAG TPA: PEP-CTERM sorting domain-containing protein [Lacipirellulaceae bacterium]